MLTRIQTSSSLHSPKLPWIAFLVFGIVGVILLLGHSTWGIGVTHDSVFYLSSASNLTEGEGLYWIGDRGRLRVLTHFAPLYPIVLSPFIALGVDPEVAALWFAAISFGLIISSIGYIVYHFTRRLWIGSLASALALVSPVIMGVHTIALSEPLFLLLTLGFLTSLSRYVIEPGRSKFILVAGLAALGYLTRYVGVTLLFTGFLGILAQGKREFRTRLGNAILFFLTAFSPMAIWMLRNYSVTGTTTNRTLLFHPPESEVVLKFLDTIVSWILPLELSARYQVVIVSVSALILIYLLSRTLLTFRHHDHLMLSFIRNTTLFLFIYLSSLAFSITFVDASTPLDDRILSPVYIGLLILCILLFWSNSMQRINNLVLIPIVLLIAIVAWNNWSGSSETLGHFKEDGIGFTSREWRESETIVWLSNISESALIYTNERFAITYITERPAFSIPEKIDTVTDQVRPEFDQALAKMHDRLETPDSYLLLFHPYGLRFGMPTRDEITFPLSRLEELNDALVYIDPINVE